MSDELRGFFGGCNNEFIWIIIIIVFLFCFCGFGNQKDCC